jgi:hypothetical protein
VSRFSATVPTHCELPRSLRVRAEQLLDRQLWLWNLDIRHPSGNLLIDYGFTASRTPAGALDSTVYTLALPTGRRLLASECGLYISRVIGHGDILSEGVFVRRLGFEPRRAGSVVEDACGGLPLQPGRLRSPKSIGEWVESRTALCDAVRAVAAYEEWVITRFGVAYRRTCLGHCASGVWRGVVSADETVAAWRTLADWYNVESESAQPIPTRH